MAEKTGSSKLLYGADGRAHLVGCTPSEGGMALWWRGSGAGDGGGQDPPDGDGGQVHHEDVPYSPFFLLSHRELLDQFKPEPRTTALGGQSHRNYGFKVECDGWKHCDEAIAHVNRIYRAHKSDFTFEPVLKFSDPVNQYLLASGQTHYKDELLAGLNVLYFTIRARPSGGAEYADPQVEGDQLLMVGLADGRGWEVVLRLCGMSEKDLIELACEIILDQDPDVIVGHDIFKHDLSYFAARAKRHKVKLNWGRDGSAVSIRKSRAPAAEKQLEYPRIGIAGRSVVDTWFLTQYYDIVKRELEQYDAPYVAGYLDKSSQLPPPLPTWEIDELYDSKRELVLADVKYELQAAAIIFRTLAPSYFAQAQMLPLTLQDCVVRGNGVKVNNLLMREYLRRGEAIPAPVEARTFVGGHTEIRQSGLIRDVLNVDIASLYPSIMLSHGIKPASDHGGVFQPLLNELTSRRLQYKRLARSADDQRTRVSADARQAALKVFINSFFGYLGTNRMNWADPQQAEKITTTGQQLVKQLAEYVEAEGGEVIEIDTDGVYFTAPVNAASVQEREELVERINSRLPEGINVELGGYFPAMLSYKVKNYALLHEDSSITIKGSGMKSRGLEPYLHGFIEFSIKALLRGRSVDIEQRFNELRDAIAGRSIDISQLAKTDTLIDTLDTYTDKVEAGKRNRAAAYEVALQAKRRLRPGDQVSYYITGEKATVKAYEAAKPLRQFSPGAPDYNIKYYVKKLEQNLKKVKGFLPERQQDSLFDA